MAFLYMLPKVILFLPMRVASRAFYGCVLLNRIMKKNHVKLKVPGAGEVHGTLFAIIHFNKRTLSICLFFHFLSFLGSRFPINEKIKLSFKLSVETERHC